jgi:2-polyprenyl-3-methyl-5-hydroxy-6-metoxy-1,4-benzoquinol methylase
MSSVAVLEQFDSAKAEAFAGRMLGVLNSGALALMTSIGHQTGLFDTMSELPPSTTNQIAAAAGLNERYVREWLGAMVVGGIVDYEPETRRYWLTPEHAATLTRAAGVDNIAFTMQYLPVIASVEQGIVDCFRNGGGLTYASFPRFQQVQAEETARVFDLALVSRILPLVPDLPARLGMGISVADIGTGMGHAVNVMAKAYPRSSFTGYDFSQEGIAAGRAEARRMGLSNVRFEVKDVAEIDTPGAYDLVTAFDAIHDQIKPREVLRRIAKSLAPGGVFLMADIAASSDLRNNIGHPLAPTLFTISTMHCMTVSLSHGGEGLGSVWGREKALELLAEAGFASVEVHRVEGDQLNEYFVARLS